MSSLDKLNIRGIRSFGPEDRDVATIRFSSPLTLILGQNGCGKTTIIEALKFAACGDVPGGTDGGSGFVHDPELARLPQVRGQVKLRCSDTRGKMHTVVKTIQATRKLKKLEFKSLDSTVSTDEKGSISGRCADIDALMCNVFGVSKAILNNVIFCHQEDSAWPLETGKKIKDKFDSIFGITEYNKCLDYLRQLVKDIKIEKDKMEIKVSYKEQNWTSSLDKRKKLQEKKTQLLAIADEMADIDRNIEPIDAQLRELLQKELNLGEHVAKVKEKKYRMNSIKESITEMKNKIQSEFEGSTEELRFKIETFEKGLSEREAKLHDLVEEKENVISKETRLQKEISVKQMLLGTLQSDDKQNNDRILSRNQYLRHLTEELKLPLMSNSEINENEEELLRSIENKIKDCNKQLEELQEEQDSMEKLLQNKIDSCREKKIRLEHDIQSKKKSLEDNKKDMRKVNLEIAEVDKSTETLAELEKNLETINKELSILTNSLDLNECKVTIQRNSDTINSLEENLSSLVKEIKTLQKVSIEKANLEKLQERKKSQENEFNKLKEKNSSSLKHLLSEVPDSNFKSKLDTCIQKISTEIRNIENSINNEERELSALNEKKTSAIEALTSKRRKLFNISEKINDCCGSVDIDTYIAKINAEIDDVQVRKGTMNASKFLFKRYVDSLNVNPICPLCRREFSENNEVQKLIAELNSRLDRIPAELEGAELELKNVSKRHTNTLQLKPIAEEINTLTNEEIPQLQTKVTNISTQIETVQARIDENRQRLFGPQTDEMMAKNLLSDVTLMDQYQRDIQNLIREISKLESQLPALASTKSLKDANDEQDAVRSQLMKTRKEVDDDQKKLATYNEKMSKLSHQKNKLTTQQLKIAGGVQQRKNLSEKLSDLQTLESVLSAELQSAEAQLYPISQELEEHKQDLNKLKSSHKRLLQAKKEKIIGYEKKVDDTKKLQHGITDYNRGGGTRPLVNTRKELAEMQLEKDNLVACKNNLEKEIENINQFRNTQQLKKIDLANNLQLRNKKEEFVKIQQELNDLEGSTETINAEQMQRVKQELAVKRKNFERKRSHAEGRQEELQSNILEIERELSKEQYRNAEDEYRKSLVEFTVTGKAIEDLKEYIKAMDWVMIHFHKDRMKMINNIVHELWRSIYRGNDIDYIEVKTEEGSTSTSTGKRTYNYKVVQVKNSVELDMRGRCSAGQKVLACLIIRMALAETFSRNCGILALDEPTTNLDKDNVESLSEALAEIVDRRSKQRNFQLIVITHDEEFLQKLLRIDKVGHYLEVKRDNRGKSVVIKREWR